MAYGEGGWWVGVVGPSTGSGAGLMGWWVGWWVGGVVGWWVGGLVGWWVGEVKLEDHE